MNKSNVQKAIKIMLRVISRKDSFDMSRWQQTPAGETKLTEADLHTCTSAACFGGWVAVSPEFIEDGGNATSSLGEPVYKSRYQDNAIAEWLDINGDEAEGLCAIVGRIRLEDTYPGVGTNRALITPEMVVDALIRLLNTGSVFVTPEGENNE